MVLLGSVLSKVARVALDLTLESVPNIFIFFDRFRVAVFDQMTMSEMVDLPPMKIGNERKILRGERNAWGWSVGVALVVPQYRSPWSGVVCGVRKYFLQLENGATAAMME